MILLEGTSTLIILLKVIQQKVLYTFIQLYIMIIFKCVQKLQKSCIISAPGDYTALNDSFEISDSALLQCVPISITSDSVDEEQECFTFSLSTATSVAGLTLSPSEAEICISDAEGAH